MLFDPDRHEPLHPADEAGWDEARARACIAGIVCDTEAHFRPRRGWRVHPLDLDPTDDPQFVNPSLYTVHAAFSGRCTISARWVLWN